MAGSSSVPARPGRYTVGSLMITILFELFRFALELVLDLLFDPVTFILFAFFALLMIGIASS